MLLQQLSEEKPTPDRPSLIPMLFLWLERLAHRYLQASRHFFWYGTRRFPTTELLTPFISFSSSNLGSVSSKPALLEWICYMRGLQGWILIPQARNTDEWFKQPADVSHRGWDFQSRKQTSKYHLSKSYKTLFL